jgi:hypothetical protein
MVPHDRNNLPPIQIPKSGQKSVKTNQIAPIDTRKPIQLDATSNSTFGHELVSQPTPTSLTNLNLKSRGVPDEATSLEDVEESPTNLNKALSMRDPSDLAQERSKAFNAFFGLFFASGGLYVGYAITVLGPLGEKWLKFNFGIKDDAAMFFVMANVV